MIRLILPVLIFFFSLPAFSQTAPPPASKDKLVLAGLVLRYGDVIDGIQPIYKKIRDNGTLGEISSGNFIGGFGGNEMILFRPNHVITGFFAEEGDYFGARHITRLRIVWQKWGAGRPEGDLILSERYGRGSFTRGTVETEIIAPFGRIVSLLTGTHSCHSDGNCFLSTLSIQTASTIPEKDSSGLIKTAGSVNYDFEIQVISGFNEGKKYRGSFSYDSSLLKGRGEETIEVSDIQFTYENDAYIRSSFDSVPTAVFQDGKFKDLVLVGGPTTKRFGLNAGFDRRQFGRPSEAFILEGKSYFGYLDAATYVEGAGKVIYIKK
ncbi:MAG TPA: hypothetical protein PK453_06885 [Leptospiraceae bacterium]|nr:hypothetical protein [Leptospiraceae bacterium]